MQTRERSLQLQREQRRKRMANPAYRAAANAYRRHYEVLNGRLQSGTIVFLECLGCGRMVHFPWGRRGVQIYCSRKCGAARRSKKYEAEKPKLYTGYCLMCGTPLRAAKRWCEQCIRIRSSAFARLHKIGLTSQDVGEPMKKALTKLVFLRATTKPTRTNEHAHQ